MSREGSVGVREAAEVRTREGLRQRVARVGRRDGSLSLMGGAVPRRVSSCVVDKAPDPKGETDHQDTKDTRGR